MSKIGNGKCLVNKLRKKYKCLDGDALRKRGKEMSKKRKPDKCYR
jgi:hypothetical protein